MVALSPPPPTVEMNGVSMWMSFSRPRLLTLMECLRITYPRPRLCTAEMDEESVDNFLPPRHTVQVELYGVHVDDFLPSPPTVRVELERDHVGDFLPPP